MDGGARSASVARKAYMDAAFTPGRTFARIVEELSKCGYAVAGRSAPRCCSAASVPHFGRIAPPGVVEGGQR